MSKLNIVVQAVGLERNGKKKIACEFFPEDFEYLSKIAVKNRQSFSSLIRSMIHSIVIDDKKAEKDNLKPLETLNSKDIEDRLRHRIIMLEEKGQQLADIANMFSYEGSDLSDVEKRVGYNTFRNIKMLRAKLKAWQEAL